MRICLAMLSSILVLNSFANAGDVPLAVHEWGTFTSLQDETGRAIGGIDEDVEPLPEFVHDLLRLAASNNKGLPIGSQPSVTMRLETPVIYFHPAENGPRTVDLSVEFHGGLLTQFYPDAKSTMSPATIFPIDALNTRSSLNWAGVKLDSARSGPSTTSHVWLAPRNVKAADVTAANGESERYLFYRGVGNLNSPLKVVREGERLNLFSQMNSAGEHDAGEFTHVWLYDLRADGTCAFSGIGPLKSDGSNDAIGWITAGFKPVEYSTQNLSRMKSEMHDALVAEGLFDDEAAAMLNTWENSYFKSPGTRVFFTVPRGWVDRTLPLKLSVDAKINRVMIGRIDLVTPDQRRILDAMVDAGGDLGEKKTADLYASLGRFRAAIVRDEAARHPSEAMTLAATMSH